MVLFDHYLTTSAYTLICVSDLIYLNWLILKNDEKHKTMLSSCTLQYSTGL